MNARVRVRVARIVPANVEEGEKIILKIFQKAIDFQN